MRLVKTAETLQPLFVDLKTLQHTVFEDELLPCHSVGGRRPFNEDIGEAVLRYSVQQPA